MSNSTDSMNPPLVGQIDDAVLSEPRGSRRGRRSGLPGWHPDRAAWCPRKGGAVRTRATYPRRSQSGSRRRDRVVHAYRGMRSALISLADCRAERRPLGSGPGVREAVRVASPRRESRRPPLVTRTSRRESLRAPIGAALEAGDCAHALRCPVVLRRPPGWGAQRPQAQAGAPSDSRRSISYTAAA